MGLGGNLIWTRVIASIYEREKRPLTVCGKPLLSDLVRGRLYNREFDLSDDAVFRNNHKIDFPETDKKGLLSRAVDLVFLVAIRPEWIKRWYEQKIFAIAEQQASRDDRHFLHTDMLIHSYAEKDLGDRFSWKKGGDIATVISRRFIEGAASKDCELYFSDDEVESLDNKLSSYALGEKYIVIEPGTNQDWFGELRSWPIDNWQSLVDGLNETYCLNRDIKIIQVGLKSTPLLDGVIDLRGMTTFREAALVISEAGLFVGTEGGLMHAANAVSAPSVILWGGVTLPMFAGYMHNQSVICNYVDCAPCGKKGMCEFDAKCMKGIEVQAVFAECGKCLED